MLLRIIFITIKYGGFQLDENLQRNYQYFSLFSVLCSLFSATVTQTLEFLQWVYLMI